MPIEHRIDHKQRLVMAKGLGALTYDDIWNYQREVWSRRDLAGFNELLDMSEVQRLPPVSAEEVSQMARLAASMDDRTTVSKFAIVAPQDLAFGLGRMFEAYRGLEKESTKQVAVFRSRQEALAWLGVEEEP